MGTMYYLNPIDPNLAISSHNLQNVFTTPGFQYSKWKAMQFPFKGGRDYVGVTNRYA